MGDLTRQQLCAELGISETTVRRLEREGLPFKKPSWTNRKTYNLVQCRIWLNACNTGSVEPPQTLRSFYSANARAKTMRRMPPWADKQSMRAFYEEAQRLTWASGIAHHVDHICPLQGELVSGLHVPANLRIMTATANNSKGNYFEVDA